MRRMPGSLPRPVFFTRAGCPPRASTHFWITEWLVVRFAADVFGVDDVLRAAVVFFAAVVVFFVAAVFFAAVVFARPSPFDFLAAAAVVFFGAACFRDRGAAATSTVERSTSFEKRLFFSS